MFMQRIRRATKKHRKVLTIVVILLMVGLVGSFAVWNSENVQGNTSQDLTYAEQIELYESYLAENEPATVEEADYATAYSLAGYYLALRTACAGAYQEALYAETEEEQAEAEAYATQAESAVEKAIAYYGQALAQAPDTMNDEGRAQLYAELASAQLYAANQEATRASLDQALALAPDNATVISTYANYLYGFEGFDAVNTYLTEKLDAMDAESEEYAALSQQLAYYQLMDSYTRALEDSTTESGTEEAGTEGDAVDEDSVSEDAATEEETDATAVTDNAETSAVEDEAEGE